MAKNIMVTTLSSVRIKDMEEVLYSEYEGDFSAKSKYTNETGIHYLKYKLSDKLDRILAFATKEVMDSDSISILEHRFDEGSIPKIETVFLDNKISKAFISIYKMFNKVNALKIENPEEEIYVHVDMTGGFRHAAMLMIGLIRLLKYNNIHIGYVIYTNFDDRKVENANELLDMYSVIGGAEEFVNYGNIYQISEYYKDNGNISSELKEFLLALINVSECLKSCAKQSDMERYLLKLKAILYKYKEITSDGNSTEIFIKLLLSNIESSYKDLFSMCESNDFIIGLIKWCLEKKMSQQAATFFVEYMPMFIFSKGIIDKVDSRIEKTCKEKYKREYQTWEGYLFKYYTKYPNDNRPRKIIFKELIESREIGLNSKVNMWKFLDFVEIYSDIVRDYRNKINHADYSMKNGDEINKLNKKIKKAFNKLRIVI